MSDDLSTAFEGLFAAIREAAPGRTWSRGIELSRAEAVDGISHDEDSVMLRVAAPGRPVPPVVTLFPLDEEWVCDCDSKAAACEHVAAAVIATRQARKRGAPMPQSDKAGARIGYRLTMDKGRLAIRRVAVQGERETPLTTSVGGHLAGRGGGPSIAPTEADLQIDRLLQLKRVRLWPPESLESLLTLLAQAEDVTFDGRKVRVSARKAGPRIVLRDQKGGGFVIRFEAPKALDRVVAHGVAMVAGDPPTLHQLDLTEITGMQLEQLPAEMRFGPHKVAELITSVLPDLKKRAEIEVATKRLPDRVRDLAPRPHLEVTQKGGALSVLPTLVYGDPPCARVEDDQLVHLGGPVPKRMPAKERALLTRMREELDMVPGRRIEAVGARAVALAAKLRAWEDDDVVAVEGEVHRTQYPAALTPRLSLDPLAFEASFVDGDREADANAVVDAWMRGARAVPLLDGGWAPLPEAWLEKHGARLADLLAARDANGEVAAHARPVMVTLCDALETPPPPALARLRPLFEGFEGLGTVALPSDLQADLRPYQREGVAWLKFLRQTGLGGILADDMGLGKTVQTLAALSGRTLVVCPRSVMHNWADEIRRFRPSLRFAVYHGTTRALDREADVVITTYALLRNDVDTLAAETWDTVVLDEAQAIKNPDSQVSRAAYRLQARFRLSLSGTPVENRLEELWSQMHFTNRGLLGGREGFGERYERPIAAGTPGAAAHLRERIKPFVLRRTKQEVLSDLPPRTDARLLCTLDEPERAVYDTLRLATQRDVVAQLDEGGSVLGALEALLRLRQAACDASLVPGQDDLARTEDGAPRASSKIRRLLEALEQVAADGHRALVFSQWTSLLDRVEPFLTAAGIDFCRLDGSTRDRAGVVGTFQAPEGPPVMLLSLKAGGTGLNLTAADHVFLLDPWWNPAVEDQAADRAHRYGQERPVMVYRVVAEETVEERILALQASKRALADAALGQADRAVGITRDDLLALLA
ncbi:MAG: DEAD/DEAH box helicase [Myxococcota bacterium]